MEEMSQVRLKTTTTFEADRGGEDILTLIPVPCASGRRTSLVLNSEEYPQVQAQAQTQAQAAEASEGK